ncbi:MAG: sensor histidine kinase [Desulfovibrionaceae bacterium]
MMRYESHAALMRHLTVAVSVLTLAPMLLLALVLMRQYPLSMREATHEVILREAQCQANVLDNLSALPNVSGDAGNLETGSASSGSPAIFVFDEQGTMTGPQGSWSSPAGATPPAMEGLAEEARMRGSAVRSVTLPDGGEAVYAAARLRHSRGIVVVGRKDAALSTAWSMAIWSIICLSTVAVFNATVFASWIMQGVMASDKRQEHTQKKIVEANKLAAVGELAAGVAHEVNNPVAIMVQEAGWVEDLLEEVHCDTADTNAEIRRALAQIKTQGARCREITRGLLEFARRGASATATVPLNELMETTAGLCMQRASTLGVSIRLRLDPTGPACFASPTNLQQVLFNLINNALDAMKDEGGELVLATGHADDMVTFTVADSGPGMDQAVLMRVFEPFFTTKPVGQGTGLGLSICHGLVRQAGGRISVKSGLGRGTSFTVHLPAASKGKAAPAD